MCWNTRPLRGALTFPSFRLEGLPWVILSSWRNSGSSLWLINPGGWLMTIRWSSWNAWTWPWTRHFDHSCGPQGGWITNKSRKRMEKDEQISCHSFLFCWVSWGVILIQSSTSGLVSSCCYWEICRVEQDANLTVDTVDIVGFGTPSHTLSSCTHASDTTLSFAPLSNQELG